jgi:hypothetical protein
MRSLSTRSLRVLAESADKDRQRHYDAHVRKVLEIEAYQNNKKVVASQNKIA